MIYADHGSHLWRVVDTDTDTETWEQEAHRNDELEVDVFAAWHVYRVISETLGWSPITYWQSNGFKMASKHGWKTFTKLVSTVKLLV